MNEYERWGADSREEYKSHSGGFYAASAGMLQLLLDEVDTMQKYHIDLWLEWVNGEPGANWTEHSNDAIRGFIEKRQR